MENETYGSLDIMGEINASLLQAKLMLNESPQDRFNRNVLRLIQEEIKHASASALHWKFVQCNAHEYTHTGNFPLMVYNELSQELLSLLETKDIYIFCDTEKSNHATIKIILHF